MTVGLGSTRNLSFWRSTPTPAPSSVPPPSPITPEEVLDNVSEPEVIAGTTPVPESTSVSELVSSLDIPSTLQAPPLNYGDLAALGFSHWTPPGIAQWTMELIQVSSGMSWFWTIVTASILSRLVILPFSINSVRSAAKLAPYQPRLMKLRNELQNTGGLTRDPLAVQRISLQQKKVYEEAGVSLFGPLMTPLLQVPISMGLFLGIKKLCDFPLEQLKVGGTGWITDLTVADPTYALSLAMVAMIHVQLSVSVYPAHDLLWHSPLFSPVGWCQGPRHKYNSGQAHIQRVQDSFARVFTVVHGFPCSMHLFSVYYQLITTDLFTCQGVMVYLVSVTATVVAQTLFLRVPAVRKALGIPKIPDHTPVKSPTFMETVKFGVEWMKNKNAEAQAQARAQQRKKF